MNPQVLSVIAGVSGVFGTLALFGYFFLQQNDAKAPDRSLRELVEGERLIDGDTLVAILKEFPTETGRFNALKAILKDGDKARTILEQAEARTHAVELDRQQGRGRARWLMISAFTFLALAGITLAAAFAAQPTVPVKPPVPLATHDFEVFSYDRKLDLSQWQFVPDGHATEKLSPVLWNDKLKVRRLNARSKSFVIRHATTGIVTPEFSSDTHHVEPHETVEKPQEGKLYKLRIFDVSLDVSGEPVDQWFPLELKAKYWNACNDPEKGWAAIPIVHPTENLVFEIQFPASKPVETWERRVGPRDTTTSDLITDDAIWIDPNNQVLRWTVDHPQRNWVYKYVWKW